jgi:hypothetical protein
MDVLRTNGFGIGIRGVQHLALFVDGSVRRHLIWMPGISRDNSSGTSTNIMGAAKASQPQLSPKVSRRRLWAVMTAGGVSGLGAWLTLKMTARFGDIPNSEMAMEVVALRDIGAGEEITHSCKE